MTGLNARAQKEARAVGSIATLVAKTRRPVVRNALLVVEALVKKGQNILHVAQHHLLVENGLPVGAKNQNQARKGERNETYNRKLEKFYM